MTWFDDNLAAGDLAILFKVSPIIRRERRAAREARTLRRIHPSLPPDCAHDLTARRQVTERLEIRCEVKTVGAARPICESCTNIGRSEAHDTLSFGERSGSFADVVNASRPRRAHTPVVQLPRWVGTLAADRLISAELPPEDAAVASFLSCRGKGSVPTDLMRSL
ncbi:hypothetical protein SAMN05216330_12525 [Bradyrhizobium sp. Ghvi]|uniref:hypothetical protein n=1 Tax=Bradyrhizobium sp. Ghvi TaxID=1855319 RepID=UPI0008EE84FF|nr:hypothetical protein [Bradyrhizobium sp. Ghvi]SFQ31367.1 hypothetical protein SAMN05216330_12525 [Bradyrhizobium sp. Ghvi]